MDAVDDLFPIYPGWDSTPTPSHSHPAQSHQPASSLSFHATFSAPSASPHQLAPTLPVLPGDDALSILPTSVVTSTPLHADNPLHDAPELAADLAAGLAAGFPPLPFSFSPAAPVAASAAPPAHASAAATAPTSAASAHLHQLHNHMQYSSPQQHANSAPLSHSNMHAQAHAHAQLHSQALNLFQPQRMHTSAMQVDTPPTPHQQTQTQPQTSARQSHPPDQSPPPPSISLDAQSAPSHLAQMGLQQQPQQREQQQHQRDQQQPRVQRKSSNRPSQQQAQRQERQQHQQRQELHQQQQLQQQQQQHQLQQQQQQQQQHLRMQLQMPQSASLPQQQQPHQQPQPPSQQQTRPQSAQRRKSSQPQQRQQHSAQTATQRKQQAQTTQQQQSQQAQQRRQQAPQRPAQKQKTGRMQKQPTVRQKQSQQLQQQQRQQQEFNLLQQQDHQQTPLQQNRPQPQPPASQQQSQQNLFSSMTPPSIPQVLSNISIPTPTIATGTTITGTPSATNSTHRSPPRTPRTPHSSNRGKSTAVSGQRETQSDVHSSIDKNTAAAAAAASKQLKHQSIATTNAKHSQSSSQMNTQTGPTSASASAQHPMPVAGQRVSKPRDKQAKLRKRLKCCSHDQLVDQIIELVRSSAVSEKVMYDLTPRVDIRSFVTKCEALRDAIYAQLREDANTASPPYDSNAHRRCKKSVANFKTNVLAMGKMLVDAALWAEVIEYCVAAAAVNEQTPIWTENSHNKSRASVSGKLEQLAVRAATALTKAKGALASPDDKVRLINSCRKLFPSVAIKLEGPEPGSAVEGSAEGGPAHPDFDGPIIGNNPIEIGM